MLSLTKVLFATSYKKGLFLSLDLIATLWGNNHTFSSCRVKRFLQTVSRRGLRNVRQHSTLNKHFVVRTKNCMASMHNVFTAILNSQIATGVTRKALAFDVWVRNLIGCKILIRNMKKEFEQISRCFIHLSHFSLSATLAVAQSTCSQLSDEQQNCHYLFLDIYCPKNFNHSVA